MEKVTFGEGVDNIPRLLFSSEFQYEDEDGNMQEVFLFKNLRTVDCGNATMISEQAFWGSFVNKLILHPANINYGKIIRSCPALSRLEFGNDCVIGAKELIGADVAHILSIDFGDFCVIKENNFNSSANLGRVKFGKQCSIESSFCDCSKLKSIELGEGVEIKDSFNDNFGVTNIKFCDNTKFVGRISFVGKTLRDNDLNRRISIVDNKGKEKYSYNQKIHNAKYGYREWGFPIPLKKIDSIKESTRNVLYSTPIYKDVIRYAINNERLATLDKE